MGSIGLRVALAVVLMGMAGLGFSGTEAAPGGITKDMTVREAGRKAATMSSKEIGASIQYLKAQSAKAGAAEKANIEAIIAKLERKKKSREGEEKAEADAKKHLAMAGQLGNEEEKAPSKPSPAAKEAPDEDAWMYNVTMQTFNPVNAKMAARSMKKEKLEKYIGVLEKKKEEARASGLSMDADYDRVLKIYREQLGYRK